MSMTGRSRRLVSASAVVLVLGLLPTVSTAQVWSTFLGGSTFDQPNATRLDPAGDLLVAGSSYTGIADGNDFTVAKFALGASGALVWQTNLKGTDAGGFDEALAVDVDAGGDVVAGGRTKNAGTLWDFTVAKFSGADGSLLWRQDIAGTGNHEVYVDYAASIVVDSIGDVVAAGRTVNAGTDIDFTVAKFSGATGAQLWRYDIATAEYGTAYKVALDAADDALVSGSTNHRFTVVKLDGATGTELWRYVTDGDPGTGLAADAAGDVLAVGTLPSGTNADLGVVKLSGASGTELWRATISGAQNGGGFGVGLVLDALGNVVATGGLQDASASGTDFAVVKLVGADGTELWRRVIVGSGPGTDYASKATLDASGDVIATGTISNVDTGDDFAVVKLAGATGDVIWQREVNGTDNSNDGAWGGPAIAPSGDVVAAGMLVKPPQSFAVVAFGSALGNDWLLSGKRFLVKDPASPKFRRLLVLSTDPRMPPVPPGSSADPTVGGATLELRNPTTAETAAMALPAARWSGLGSPPGSAGYSYADPSQADGPCSRVMLTPTTFVARCGGDGVDFTLDEPTQGSLGLRLSTGTGNLRRCIVFGGTVNRDAGSMGRGAGVFKASEAPPPLACP